MKVYNGIDISKLMLLGKGTQGSVYKIDEKAVLRFLKRKLIVQMK